MFVLDHPKNYWFSLDSPSYNFVPTLKIFNLAIEINRLLSYPIKDTFFSLYEKGGLHNHLQ